MVRRPFTFRSALEWLVEKNVQWALFFAALVLAIILARNSEPGPWPAVVTSGAVLTLAATTLTLSRPKPAHFSVGHDSQPGRPDLTFGGVDQNGQTIPTGYHLQHHVVVTNDGNKRGAIVRLELTAFERDDGELVNIPWLPLRVQGHLFQQQMEYQGGGVIMHNRETPPPYNLEPQDTIVLRFYEKRTTRLADNDRVTALCNALQRPIVGILGEIRFRSGLDEKTERFRLPARSENQEPFRLSLLAAQAAVPP